MKENPFDITKAVHYTNEQLLDFWVNLPGEEGFDNIINPKSSMPMMIIGGKGSGKTHLLKYYSYDLQKLRYSTSTNQNSIVNSILADGYLGLYTRAGNLNSKKFQGKSYDENAWLSIFEYYFDLFLSQITIDIFCDISKLCPSSIKNEELCCQKILNLFDKTPPINHEITTLKDILFLLSELQKKIDYSVNKSSLLGRPREDLDILSSDGKLILGIPKILREHFGFMQKVQFSYLIDEFENFTFEQQKFINTLIREIEAPLSIKIGARHYGIKTYSTFSGGEDIRKGAEYEEINIDQIFRKRPEDYSNFIKTICLKRLNNTGYDINDPKDLSKYFENFNIEKLNTDLLSKNKISHREKLKNDLKFLKSEDLNQILSLLFFDDLILEKASILLFYRSWKSNKINSPLTFIEGAMDIYVDRENGDSKNKHKSVLEKFKYDLIDQLCAENQLKISYAGIDNFIKMSAGIPRLVLLILKHIFRWAQYNDEEPFQVGQVISLEAQNLGVQDASNWFLEDARISGKKGVTVKQSISKLGQFLKTLKFSDTPPECSINAFVVNKLVLSAEREEILNYLIQYSYLIKSDDRADKNHNRKDMTLHLIGILAPQFGLSLNIRGVINIDNEVSNKIFGESENSFEKLISSIESRYNAPFKDSDSSLFLFQ